MFKALMVHGKGAAAAPALVELDDTDLPEGEVTVRVQYSSLNYKDALAITGRGAILKSFPMIAGIDLAGVVESSHDAAWQPGDAVVVNGWGLGENRHGGLTQKTRLAAGWLLKLPAAYGAYDAMAIGTAGYTAALCVLALRHHGLAPADGPILVTGASGGVGAIAVLLLARLGYEVHAASGRASTADYLRGLGAAALIGRASLAEPGRPLQSERWAGVVDTVGSHTLANACAATKWKGAVAACGLAQGADFPATVMPFILRGITLYGINCVLTSNAERTQAWDLLAAYVPPAMLAGMSNEIALSEAIAAASDLLEGKLQGRAIVNVNR
jgi:acrylyl-CoA reductase (NADPH)